MEWSILFMGPVGAGKTKAIASVSDSAVLSTEVCATDAVQQLKPLTTVAMDMGLIRLDDKDKIVLYGAPGQDRFDFMWDILLVQAKGLVLLIDHSRPDPMADLVHYLDALGERQTGPLRPLVIGITHTDSLASVVGGDLLEKYQECIRARTGAYGGECLPVFTVDARMRGHVRCLLQALTAMMDVAQRYPKKSAA